MLRPNPTLRFAIRLLPERRSEMLVQPLGSWGMRFVESSGGTNQAEIVDFFPSHVPEPFALLVVADHYFLLRESGPLELIPAHHMEPVPLGIYNERNLASPITIDDEGRPHGRPHDELASVADFSAIPDWVSSDSATRFMVEDRDRKMVRFFWGVSGYAELELVDRVGRPQGPAATGAAPAVRFEELPAPPEMERVRSLLLSPPDFERPTVHYLHDPDQGHFFSPKRGLPWRE